MASSTRQLPVVLALGTTQTLAWASSYYLVAILADPIARDLDTSSTAVFAAFSAALLISAMLGPRVGRTIDLIGGRGVLTGSKLVFAAGLVLLSVANSQALSWLAWLVFGVAMGLGLYDTAFATLGRIYGDKARSAITGITLLAGFASTVGWPLTAWGAEAIGRAETGASVAPR
jgi:MFS family permease